MPSFIALLTAQPALSLPYGLLWLAIVSIWWKPSIVWWTLLLAASAAVGFHTQVLSESALILTVTLWLFCFLSFYVRAPRIRVPTRFVIIILTCMILVQYFEGFQPWRPVINIDWANRVIPFTHTIHYAHALLGLCILGMHATPLIRRSPDWVILLKDSAPIALTACFSIYMIAYYDPVVSMHFRWNSYYKFWALCQVLFVCVAEEAIFRGMIQCPLSRLFERWTVFRFPIGIWVALLIASAFYTLRHVYEGESVMIYNGIAGLFYGYAYLRTRRIESSIFVHWMLSSFDILVFSYPMLS